MSLSMVDGETLWGVYKVSNFKSDENLRRFERAIALSCQFPLALYIQINHIYIFHFIALSHPQLYQTTITIDETNRKRKEPKAKPQKVKVLY